MLKPKGGRGHAAPYDTKLMRVPVPLAEQVSQLVGLYQEFIQSGGEAFRPPQFLDGVDASKLVNKNEDAEQAPMWRKGDFCAVRMPASGVVIPKVRIGRFDPKTRSCKVIDDTTDSHWLSSIDDMIPLSLYEILEKFARENKELQQQVLNYKQATDQVVRLEQEITAIRQQRDQLDAELDELHGINGNLNQEIELLKQQVAETNKPVNNLNKPVNNIKQRRSRAPGGSLTQRALARRLNCDHTSLGRYKSSPDRLAAWTAARDPEKQGWRYDEAAKAFYPLSQDGSK